MENIKDEKIPMLPHIVDPAEVEWDEASHCGAGNKISLEVTNWKVTLVP